MPGRGARDGVDASREDPFVGLLVKRLVEQGRDPVTPVTVAALCKTLLPYGACRQALGVASKGEYDVALLRFMHSGGVLTLDQELATAVERELANPEPGLAFLKNFAAAKMTIYLGREGLARRGVNLEREGYGDEAAETSGDLDELLSEPSGEHGDELEEVAIEPAAEPEQPMSPTVNERTVRCHGCDKALPEDRRVLFCPFCGHDQSLRLCAECGEDLTAEWRFCPRCGTAVERP